jgi:hypothetical protein
MKAERKETEGFISEEIGESHQGPIIVRDTLSALEGPYRAAKNPAEVSKAVNVGILENLLTVVIDKRVGKRVDVGQEGQQYQYEEHDSIVLSILVVFPIQPTFGHEIIVAEGAGGF